MTHWANPTHTYRRIRAEWIELCPSCHAKLDGFDPTPATNAVRGKSLSAEHKAKIGAAHRGKLISAEMRAKISAANSGKKRSPEHIEILRAVGRRPKSAETRAKMSAAAMARKRRHDGTFETKV